MRRGDGLGLVVAAVCSVAGTAWAEPMSSQPSRMSAAGTTALGTSRAPKRFYFRAGALHLAPFIDSENVELTNLSDFARIAVEEGPIENSGAGMGSLTVPVMIVGYVLPVLDGRLSIETLLGLPVTLELEATGSIATESLAPMALGNVPTGVPALGSELGTAKALPPIVTAVYRFLPEARIHPYLGAGLNYMYVYDAKITNPILTEVSTPWLEVEDAIGVVAQAGVDARIFDRYYAVLDVKVIGGLNMAATVHDVYVRTPAIPIFDNARVGDAKVEINVVPLLVTAGVGADF